MKPEQQCLRLGLEFLKRQVLHKVGIGLGLVQRLDSFGAGESHQGTIPLSGLAGWAPHSLCIQTGPPDTVVRIARAEVELVDP